MNDLNIKKRLKHCGEGVILSPNIRIRHPENCSIGDKCIIDDFNYLSGSVSLGNGVHLGSSCNIQAGSQSVTIGDYTGISSGVRIFAVSSNYLSSFIDLPTISSNTPSGNNITLRANVVIGDACLVGSNSIILPGVVLPNGISIGALSLVSDRKYKEYSFYEGKCRKPLFKRNKEKIIEQLKNLKNEY